MDLGVAGEEGLEAGEVAGAAEHVHLEEHGERVCKTLCTVDCIRHVLTQYRV